MFIKKIIFFTSLFPSYRNPVKGKFNFARAEALKSLGFNVQVISPIGLTPPSNLLFPLPKAGELKKYYDIQKPGLKKGTYEGFKVHYPEWFWLPKQLFWQFEADLMRMQIGNEINTVISEFEPDLILTSWLNPYAVYSKYLKKSFNVPVVSFTEGSDILIHPKKFQGIKRVKKIVEANVDKLFYVSEHSERTGREYFNNIDSYVVRNGYNEKVFTYDDSSEKMNKKLNIISVGGHSRVKGHDLLLKAVAGLPKVNKLTLCGDGPLTSKYKKYAAENNLNDKVIFTGEIPSTEIKQHLRKCNIYCQPSRSEGIPSAPLEAMACGVPVIASRAGGLPEIIIEGFNGLLFEPDSVHSLTESIMKAVEINWDRRAISEHAKLNYGWSKWAAEFTGVLRQPDISVNPPENNLSIAEVG